MHFYYIQDTFQWKFIQNTQTIANVRTHTNFTLFAKKIKLIDEDGPLRWINLFLRFSDEEFFGIDCVDLEQ